MEEPISEGKESQASSVEDSNEQFFGILVMTIVLMFLVLLASYGGRSLYHVVKNSRSDASMPSIESIPLAPNTVLNEEKSEISKSEEKSTVTDQERSINKKIAIKVLNGGAAKGSASAVAELLKEAGYTAISTGNSAGDYVGVSVTFLSPASENDADSVREALSKKYPSSAVKSAIQGNADMAASPITVIVGEE